MRPFVPGVLTLLLAAPSLVLAQPTPKERAKAHIDRATQLYEASKFGQARTELEAAYAIDPSPDLLFALGQVHVQLGKCPEASSYYKLFVTRTSADDDVVAITRQAVAACQQAVDAPRGPSGPTPWYKDVIGDALVIGGAAAVISGIVVYASARGDLDDAEAAPSLPRYNELVDGAHTKRAVSVGLLGVGTLLVAGGVLRYKLRDRGGESDVMVAPTAGGGMMLWTGRF